MNLVQFSESKTLNHAFKLFSLTIFTLSALVASGIAGPSIATQLLIPGFSPINNTNGTAYNAISSMNPTYNITAYFNISVLGVSNNITAINISANSSNVLFAVNNASAANLSCIGSTPTLINCTNTTGIGVKGDNLIAVNLTILSPGAYAFYINVSNDTSANSVLNKSTAILYVDVTPPTYVITINGTSTNYNVTAGKYVNVTVNFTSDIAPLSSVTLNVSIGALVLPCSSNSTISTAGLKFTQIANCTFFNTTWGGQYGVSLTSSDLATNSNNTAQGVNAAYFVVWNTMPRLICNTSEINISQTSAQFGQKKQRYDIMVPIYQGENNLSVAQNAWVSPMAYDNGTMITANVMEDLAYNYTVQLNFTVANGTIVNFNLSLMQAALVNISNMTVHAPDGTTKVMTMMMPDFAGGEFTIYWNGLTYQSIGAINETHPVNGTYTMNTGLIQLSANATKNMSNSNGVNLTLIISTKPPINVTQQSITGFTPTAPPQMGGMLNTSYYVNLSAINEYFLTDNMTVTFMFPKNMTFLDISDTTINGSQIISTEVLLYQFNQTSSAWVLIANSSNDTIKDARIVKNISETLNMSGMAGSPMSGKNVTVNLWGFRYYLTNETSTPFGWKLGNSTMLNASAVLNFSFAKNVSGSGAAGTAVQYNATINAGVKGGISIPDSELPGFSTSATVNTVTLNGQTLTEGVHFIKGSINITGVALQQGSNALSITYTVPAAATPTGTIGGGGGGGVGESQGLIFQLLEAGVASVGNITDKLLDLRSISITVLNDVNNIKITMSKLSGQPVEVTVALTGTAYKYFQITPQGLVDSNIATAKIKFRVNKTWFTDNSLDPSTTHLNRYHDSIWEILKTVQTSSDSDYYYFEAETPGFSTFAVTAAAAGAPPAPATCTTTCPAGKSQKAYPDCSCYTPTAPPVVTPTQPNYDWVIYLLVVAAVTMLFAFLIYERARLTKKR